MVCELHIFYSFQFHLFPGSSVIRSSRWHALLVFMWDQSSKLLTYFSGGWEEGGCRQAIKCSVERLSRWRWCVPELVSSAATRPAAARETSSLQSSLTSDSGAKWQNWVFRLALTHPLVQIVTISVVKTMHGSHDLLSIKIPLSGRILNEIDIEMRT